MKCEIAVCLEKNTRKQKKKITEHSTEKGHTVLKAKMTSLYTHVHLKIELRDKFGYGLKN